MVKSANDEMSKEKKEAGGLHAAIPFGRDWRNTRDQFRGNLI